MRSIRLAAAVLAVAALPALTPTASAEPLVCVYVEQRRIEYWTIRSMEVCLLTP